MKKLLLLSLSLACVVFVYAQRNYDVKSFVKEKKVSFNYLQKVGIEPVKKVNIPDAGFNAPATKNTRDLTIFPLGAAANAYSYGYGGGQRTILWADDNLGVFVNLHRMTADVYSGNLALDISYDRGQTFSNNVQIYESNESGGEYNLDAARYPQGGIYNPAGNEDPDNAVFTYFCPTTRGTNGGTWGGYCWGVADLGNLEDTTKHVMNLHGDVFYHVPDGFTIAPNGTSWLVDINIDWATGAADYLGNLIVEKGNYNASSGDYEYEEMLLEFETIDNSPPTMSKIAFGNDSQIGYMVSLADDGSVPFAEGAYYPVIQKTVDGGESWDDQYGIAIGGPDGISSIVYDWLTDEQIEEYFEPPLPDRDEILYTTCFDFDLVVDANNNPHIAVVIGMGDGAYAIYSPANGIAAFDIFSWDGGETWGARHLGNLLTFRGDFGGLSEDNRINASVTMDGTKVFISWLDTHFEGYEDNIQPDIFCVGIDPMNLTQTETKNVTEFTEAWLQSFFFVAPYYVFTDGDSYNIPFTYEDMDPADPLVEVTYMFIQDFAFTDADFTIIGMDDYDITKNMKVSQNFPNPFNKSSTINVELNKAGTLSMEIYNLMGQKILVVDKGNVNAGTHQLIIDGSNLNTGIYFYTVSSGEEKITRKMMVD